MNATLRHEFNVMYAEKFRYLANYLNIVFNKSCTCTKSG